MSKNELLDKYKCERQKCENYTRCMGYIRNLNSFNDAKRSEAKERTYFVEAKIKTEKLS